MICFFSSGESIEVSPVEPMIRIAEVPLSSWNLSRLRNAAKSVVPSLLNGVIRATNEPVRSLRDITISDAIDRSYHAYAAEAGCTAGGRVALSGAGLASNRSI